MNARARASRPEGAPTEPSGETSRPAELQADSFQAVRNAHRSEIVEDYVELIAELIEQKGEARPVDIAERLAAACRKRHRLVVSFLQALGLDEMTAEQDAEGIEHHVSERTLRAFEEFIERTELRTLTPRSTASEH